MEYCNYHKHDHVSSIMTPDTHIRCEEYVKRAVELGHTSYFTTNHGTGGDIFEAKSICDKYGIRCLFGVEGYIVPNPLEKDNRNYHIILIPRTNEAREQINLATSHASEEGYYYKPRLFLDDLLKMNPNDVYITTACVAGLLKDKDGYDQLFIPLFEHFGSNVFLEVQTHNHLLQRKINTECLRLSKKHNLKLIAANDSHYIYPEQAKDRLEYLKGKGVNYGEEDSFILDYPDYDTMLERFEIQGILTDKAAKEAIDNTRIFLECEDIYLDKEIKMPSIYPDMTPKEKIMELKNHISKRFQKICKEEGINKEKFQTYKKGILEEIKVIEDTSEINTADYFLFNEKNVDLAVNKYGGILTRTGRGSCGAFYINRILGMTQLDRFASPIKLYPERFMSTARLIENRAIPDIDFNVVEQEPFVKASRELLGEHGCYPMIAYGTMKDGEAFRNVCRSHNIPYDDYNEVAKNIEAYAEDEKWKPFIEEAKKYIGAIVSASVHPCAHVLMNDDIRKKLGVVRVGDFLCVMMTSAEADEYKYLKNDYLVVSVWKLISETFEMIGQPIMSIRELLGNIDDKVWDLYKNGLTCTLNQCDGEWATSLLKEYKPHSLREISMFVSCIRPSFNSWRDKFIAHEDYSTGSPDLDKVLESTNAYILFQENLMQYFDWLGISPSESIGLIKKISKKKIHQEDFDNLEERLKVKWIENTGSDNMFNETWKMIQSCISYGFAAPHALAVAIDSLYGAYLKANYPMEYYTVCLNNYADDDAKTQKLTDELNAFGISILNPQFRHSKDVYIPDGKNRAIYKGIASIKYLNAEVAQKMYEMRDIEFPTFIDFLAVNPCNSRQTEILIRLGFFREFGKSAKLLETFKLFAEYGSKKQLSKDKVQLSEKIVLKYATATAKLYKVFDMNGLLAEMCSTLEDKSIPLSEIIKAEIEFLGYVQTTLPRLSDNYYAILDINDKYANHVVKLYRLNNGEILTVKIKGKVFNDNPVEQCNIIKTLDISEEPKWGKTPEGEWYRKEETELILKKWANVR